MPFELSPDTLDPRPDTETLIEAALTFYKDKHQPLKVLDLGTGTGCLLLTFLSLYPQSFGVGIDIFAGALKTAQRNCRNLGLRDRARFCQGEWGACLRGTFDIIFSNPPYVCEKAYETLSPEVREYDPKTALVAGKEGLECYLQLASQLGLLLREEGKAFLELGAGQAEEVKNMMKSYGLGVVDLRQDLAGIDRCLVLRRE